MSTSAADTGRSPNAPVPNRLCLVRPRETSFAALDYRILAEQEYSR